MNKLSARFYSSRQTQGRSSLSRIPEANISSACAPNAPPVSPVYRWGNRPKRESDLPESSSGESQSGFSLQTAGSFGGKGSKISRGWGALGAPFYCRVSKSPDTHSLFLAYSLLCPTASAHRAWGEPQPCPFSLSPLSYSPPPLHSPSLSSPCSPTPSVSLLVFLLPPGKPLPQWLPSGVSFWGCTSALGCAPPSASRWKAAGRNIEKVGGQSQL